MIFKNSPTYLLLFISIILNAQNFNGTYTSNKTSYKENSKNNSSYVEETRFNIAVAIYNNNGEGDIIIQNPRVPENPVAYQTIIKETSIENDTIKAYPYIAISQHLKDNESAKIVFYIKDDGTLNLMVVDGESSQVFFNLIKDP